MKRMELGKLLVSCHGISDVDRSNHKTLQVSKNEHGEKLLKPFVNLHVTPNENIIGKIGRLCETRYVQRINGRIKNPVYIDGDSEFGEYPWQAAILKKDPKESVYVCGGTLIDNQHIITAAHCVKTYSGFDLRVRLGEWDVNHDVEFYPYVERDVISVHVHPVSSY